ncbi:exodeoxyribonuclease VII large subunit [Alkalispirochaeta sphaeroplastigenens]|uniref:Exodeoxyribonuclease 7 large subunit n=2 Tax=Alkalispirochaeta sphaeroplastigenens TaxID=1187066 RepID=A0A2S4JFC3_9SPIO|nr:exodeoxyribonuclease VII large subunit [Alkalispirochaeta sphaeroplastigenens]
MIDPMIDPIPGQTGDDRGWSSVLQVSQLTAAIKRILEDRFPEVTVEGEISNFRPASSGHWYFSLKDNSAVIQCALFRGAANRVDFDPRDGDLVRVTASVSVYPPRGSYQLIVRHMSRAGQGRILALLEERKRSLAARGLFDRSRPLPYAPRTLAVITSPGGAAIRDILQILQRRGAGVDVRILPAAVQGAAAGEEIARMVGYANRHRLGEVILVTRGGGSLEDLLPFSEEAVVLAIAASEIPVISAVGHEIDWALSDFAADYRAPTPSAAAEVVCAGEEEILNRLRGAGRSLVREYLGRLDRLGSRLERVSTEELRYRYRNYVQPWYQRLDSARESLQGSIEKRLDEARRRLAICLERVESSSPFLPLERGYAIVRGHSSGAITTRAAEITEETLDLQFHDATVTVRRHRPKEEPAASGTVPDGRAPDGESPDRKNPTKGDSKKKTPNESVPNERRQNDEDL